MLYLALAFFVPVLFAVAVMTFAPAKTGQATGSNLVAQGIVLAVVLLLIGIFLATARRHVIEVTPDKLVVKHSLYTLVVQRSEVSGVRIRQITSMDQLGLSTRKNGIAAFGYFSGWFWGAHGKLMFCALSKLPVQLISFDTKGACKYLALSADAEMAHMIEQWAAAS